MNEVTRIHLGRQPFTITVTPRLLFRDTDLEITVASPSFPTVTSSDRAPSTFFYAPYVVTTPD